MSATPNTPTPSEAPAARPELGEGRDWGARESGPRRSIFGNYARIGDKPAAASPEARPAPGSATAAVALARAFVYRTLAQAFEYPSRESWTSLSSPENLLALEAASVALQNPGSEQAAVELCAQLPVGDGAAYHDDYVAVFGHAARGSVPMNEIEFGEPKADALFQPHRLADLAAFYRAYGLNMAADAGERQDHLCVELEFMSVLAAKEAYALDGQAGGDALLACRESQRDFLREHLGRWAPAFARMLMTRAGPGLLSAFAALLRKFVEGECARFGVVAGADHLIVRQADDEAERLCEGCGLQKGPPGADAET
jgi:DMSO reductase family type II enzyme chaperone